MSYGDTLGFELLEQGPTLARMRAVVGPEHLNLHGAAHGGFVYSLADETCSRLANSAEVRAVALDAHLAYFSVVHSGEVLEAVASAEHLGRKVSTYRVEVRRGDEVVALYTGTAYRVSP